MEYVEIACEVVTGAIFPDRVSVYVSLCASPAAVSPGSLFRNDGDEEDGDAFVNLLLNQLPKRRKDLFPFFFFAFFSLPSPIFHI